MTRPYEQVVCPPLMRNGEALVLDTGGTMRMLDSAGYMPARAYDSISALDAKVDATTSALRVDLDVLKYELMNSLLKEVAGKLRTLVTENDISSMTDEDFDAELQRLLFQ